VAWTPLRGWAVLILCFMLLSGCGHSESSSDKNEVKITNGTIAKSLQDANATFAKSVDELDFLSEAESEESIAKAFTFDQKADLLVDLWSKFKQQGRPSEWLMWIAQPFEDDQSPFEIVESSPSDAYVAYVVKPDPAQREAVERCTS